MPLSPTPNYGLEKPTPGADDDVWGEALNRNADTLDLHLRDAYDIASIAKSTAVGAQATADTKVAKAGDVMTGFLTLNADPTAPLHAATRQFVMAQTGSSLADAPNDSFTYGRRNLGWAKAVPQFGVTNNICVVEHGVPVSDKRPILAGNPAPFDAASDGLQVQAKMLATPHVGGPFAGARSDGGAITLFGPTFPSVPSGVSIFAGNNTAGYKEWRHEASGTLTAPGRVIAPDVQSSQMHNGVRTGETALFPSYAQFTTWPNVFGGMVSVRGDQGASYSTGAVSCYSGSGNTGVVLFAAATAWAALSDEREKGIVGEIKDGLAAVMQIVPIRFRYLFETEADPIRVGFGAMNVQTVIPEAVKATPKLGADGKATDVERLALAPTELLPHMVSAMQQMAGMVAALTARIEALEAAP